MYREDDLSVAIRRLALCPREEFAPAFPELGTLVQAVRSERSRREEHERREQRAAEQHREMASRVLEPSRWFDDAQIAAGAVEREMGAFAKSGFRWDRPYEPRPYSPEAA